MIDWAVEIAESAQATLYYYLPTNDTTAQPFHLAGNKNYLGGY